MWVVLGQACPLPPLPQEGAAFVCTYSVNLSAGCPSDHTPYPTIFFGFQPPPEGEVQHGGRSSWLVPWGPGRGVLQEESSFLMFKNNQAVPSLMYSLFLNAV